MLLDGQTYWLLLSLKVRFALQGWHRCLGCLHTLLACLLNACLCNL